MGLCVPHMENRRMKWEDIKRKSKTARRATLFAVDLLSGLSAQTHIFRILTTRCAEYNVSRRSFCRQPELQTLLSLPALLQCSFGAHTHSAYLPLSNCRFDNRP
jgi:hypothetical protein